MWLEKILGRSKQLDEVIITIQKVITYTLIFLLIFLVVYNAFGNKENSTILNNSYLPVVSGWIGIIVGIYNGSFSNFSTGNVNFGLKEAVPIILGIGALIFTILIIIIFSSIVCSI
jgi:hypothetical protein